MEERSLQPEQDCEPKGDWPKCCKALSKAGEGVLLALCEPYSLFCWCYVKQTVVQKLFLKSLCTHGILTGITC